MSYNIDRWKTKKLKNLTVPMTAFYEHHRRDFHPEAFCLDNTKPEIIELRFCDSRIKGTVNNQILTVIEINIAGEGSGTFYNEVLERALAESTGQLEAVLVWAGGDSISRLIVKNGAIQNDEVEL